MTRPAALARETIDQTEAIAIAIALPSFKFRGFPYTSVSSFTVALGIYLPVKGPTENGNYEGKVLESERPSS